MPLATNTQTGLMSYSLRQKLMYQISNSNDSEDEDHLFQIKGCGRTCMMLMTVRDNIDMLGNFIVNYGIYRYNIISKNGNNFKLLTCATDNLREYFIQLIGKSASANISFFNHDGDNIEIVDVTGIINKENLSEM